MSTTTYYAQPHEILEGLGGATQNTQGRNTLSSQKVILRMYVSA